MKTSKSRTFGSALLTLCALVATFPLAIVAEHGNEHPGGGHPGSDGKPPVGPTGGVSGGGPMSPGEGVGSLPQMPSADTPGLLLFGERVDVARTVAGISGPGEVDVQPYDPADPSGPVVAVFSGELTVRLDAQALSSSDVVPFFYIGANFGSGSAIFGSRDQWSAPVMFSPMQSIPFPLDDLFATGMLASTVRIDAVNFQRELFRMTVRAQGDTILLRQSTF